MEQNPQQHEYEHEHVKPVLFFDPFGPEGNVFMFIVDVRALLQDNQDELKAFNGKIEAAWEPNSGKKYEDILAIASEHVEVIDVSERYEEYKDRGRSVAAADQIQKQIVAAIEKFHRQRLTLPDTLSNTDSVSLTFDDSDYSPENYLTLLQIELGRVENDIERSTGEQKTVLETYRTMLIKCAADLHRAGVFYRR